MNKAKFLITGVTSIHGWPIFNYFQQRYPDQVIGTKNRFAKFPQGANIYKANNEDRDRLAQIMATFQPDYIIHCGGLCDLDKAEENPEYAYQVNVDGAKNLAHLCENSKLIYLSYDLVFSGNNNPGTGYTENFIPDPLTVIGKTIVEAENVFRLLPNHLIIRLALPMGLSIQGDKGAMDWIDSRFRNGRVATLLYDEVRSMICIEDIGKAVEDLLYCQGLYNLGSDKFLSLYQMGEQLIKAKRYPACLLEGKTRVEFPPSPPRMGNVTLNSQKAYDVMGWIPRGWLLYGA